MNALNTRNIAWFVLVVITGATFPLMAKYNIAALLFLAEGTAGAVMHAIFTPDEEAEAAQTEAITSLEAKDLVRTA